MRLVLSYIRERLPLGRFGALALLVTLATAPPDGESWGVHLALAWCALATWRIRDDIASLDRDREDHPDRALCQARSVIPMWFAWAVGQAGMTLFLAGVYGAWAAFGFFAMTGALELVYALRSPGAGLIDLLVLLKYPILTALIAVDPIPWPAMALLFVGLIRFEVADDPTLAKHALHRPIAGAALLAELAVLVATLPNLVWAVLGTASAASAAVRVPAPMILAATAVQLAALIYFR